MRVFAFGLLFFGQMFMFGLSMLGATQFFSEQGHRPLLAILAWACCFIISVTTMTLFAEWTVKERRRRGGEK